VFSEEKKIHVHLSVYWYLVIECEEQDNVLQKDDKVQEMFDLVGFG
jgi:hypothetical protein